MGILDQSLLIQPQGNKMKNFFKNLFTKSQVTPAIPKTAKEIATENKEPWVAVLDTHVNMENIRNGFFELDWNEYFVLQLKLNGYTGENEEAIVDQWFSELCRNLGAEEGVDMDRRGSGYVNKALRDDGRTEIF
jgi:hypothetical protein